MTAPADGGRTPDTGDVRAATTDVVLTVRGLKVYFPIKKGILIDRQVGAVKAVDGVDLDIPRGRTFGLVGESGCGKSTLGRAVLRLVEPTDGEVIFDGVDVAGLGPEELRQIRRRMQMVFQDPLASLNPRQSVETIITEPLRAHGISYDKSTKVREVLDLVGMPASAATRYPHEFSGGQRQRIGIARAIALEPELIIADEPVSALDVSIQAQVINLLEELQDELGLAYLFIAHDLSVVRHISDRVAVMYLGKIVEIGDRRDIYAEPTHPYTQALLSAVPIADPALRGKRERIVLEGDIPSPANPPSGCRFRTRCWKAQEICAEEDPALIDRFGHGHPSACHFAEPRAVIKAELNR